MADRYEPIRCGNIGEAKLARDNKTKQLVALKYIQRGEKIDEIVESEIIRHCSLRHPNIIGFKEVYLTPTHLTIVVEYVDGGELFKNIRNAGRFSENEARSLFQQLISGVTYCHSMKICHKDLKLENTYLDVSLPYPHLKICDFGYSQSNLLPLQPRSKVRTPAYIAPEVLSHKEYDRKIADVWSCGVTLYVMLVGAYPFEDHAENNRDFRKEIMRIMSAQYSIPDDVHVSEDCRHILSRIFVTNPLERITIEEIISHPWFLKSLPGYVAEDEATNYQSVEEIMQIINEARMT